ncbi:trifunctional purine biosynthetic protein adenosine-3 [Periplaneta americana]|uniref:trifunctional purine biosynthetic protein adenosine-3 n=1 Tax=Periplaneta americana TaxID=6978 RepID=UPI0037E8CC36
MADVLVIGSGGREHAICWKLAQSEQVKQVYVASGNTGISHIDKVTCISLNIKDHKAVAEWCKENKINLVVVGPEDPLAGGIADVLRAAGVNCFGPGKEAARIESDKDWAKSFMDRHGIPTARWGAFTAAEKAKSFIKSSSFPALVVKASGLAAGKGVVVATSQTEACHAVDSILTDHKFGSAGNTVIVEELLEGEEVSVLAFVDGSNISVMLPSQDHKRHMDGDVGANTGGMGAYCPCPLISDCELVTVRETVLQKAVDGLKKENTPFIGVLYAGLMLTKDGPKVLEFNCRFGDPETQVILSLLESDLYHIMLACCKGELNKQTLQWRSDVYAVGVIMASRGYPESSSKGNVITGHDVISKLPEHLVFHSGTALSTNGDLVTNGGRVLIVIAIANQLAVAAAKATRACEKINFEGAQYRTDISYKGIARSLLQKGQLSYKASGVDIVAGDNLVSRIKPAVAQTNRNGVLGSIGGFGGLFDTKAAGYKDPLLVSGTDGVGTKLKIAQACQLHSTIGIDLVAMCVNDILAHGAEPLFFLDYYACGVLNVDVASQVVAGVAEGCKLAGCALVGGETAEMPGLYAVDDYDLAGFAVGAVERTKLLPHTDEIQAGDVVIALPSSGVHSNGFSLVRKIMQKCGVQYSDAAPFSSSGKTFGEELLTPTKIYVKSLLPALQSGKVKALAHITGGGLTENIPRVLPKSCKVLLDASKWTIPSVFGWLAAAGGVNAAELLRTFNCGIGTVIIVSSSDVESVLKLITSDTPHVIGTVEAKTGDASQVDVTNFVPVMEALMRPYVKSVVKLHAPERKRVGVLISGSGTNLQSLIDATVDPSRGTGAEIVLVISNKAGVQGLKRAENAGIPTKVISHTAFKSRLEFDMAVHAELVAAGVEIVCLAGFMRVLTGDFVKLWRGRLINIHPALLPLFKGTHAHRQALEAGVRITGCTAHFVEEDVDAGAILAQESVQIELGDTEESLQERVKLVEHKVFPKALMLVATGKVRLDENGKLVWTE